MKASVVLWFIIVVVLIQTSNAQNSICDFRFHLEDSEQRFVQVATLNPDLALNVSEQDLVEVLTIASEIVNRSEITAEEAADKIIQSMTDAFNATLHLPRIRNVTQDICNYFSFDFPDSITSLPDFQRFNELMVDRIVPMCNALGLSSFYAEQFVLLFEVHRDVAREHFIRLASSSPGSALHMLQSELAGFLDVAEEGFVRGIFSQQEVAQILFQFLYDTLLAVRQVPEIRNWVFEACRAEEFPYSEAINSTDRFRQFLPLINQRLPILCRDFGAEVFGA